MITIDLRSQLKNPLLLIASPYLHYENVIVITIRTFSSVVHVGNFYKTTGSTRMDVIHFNYPNRENEGCILVIGYDDMVAFRDDILVEHKKPCFSNCCTVALATM